MTAAAGRAGAWLMAMRPRQWTKNGLIAAVFLYALADAEQALPLAAAWRTLGAVVVFCLLSSGVYLINDLLDRPLDRAHPVKRDRPIASGAIPASGALALAIVLCAAALAGAAAFSPPLLGVALAYLLLQLAYSLGLKKVALLDLFVIAAGFVLRAVAGAVVIGAEISPWLLLCTLLLALFLALCKRRHEKVFLPQDQNLTRPCLARYDERLLDLLIAMVASATIVCYSLYTLWPETVEKFGTQALGFTIPFVLFGLFRYLDLVYRHERGDRPEMILLTDLPILVTLLLYGLCTLLVLGPLRP